MAESKAIHVFYKGFHIKEKLADENVRLLYLRNIWGLDQKTIGELEGVGQSVISRRLQYAKKIGVPEYKFLQDVNNLILLEDLKQIHGMDRSAVKDIELFAFAHDLLGFEIDTTFYRLKRKELRDRRAVSLVKLGVQQKRVAQAVGITQGAVSMATRRVTEKQLNFEFPDRYISYHSMKTLANSQHNQLAPKIIAAGGTNQNEIYTI